MSAQRFVRVPVVVEAMRWDGNSHTATVFLGEDYGVDWEYMPDGEALLFPTLEGATSADLGDWLIKGVEGDFYSCKPNIFEETYEAMEATE